MKPVNRKWLTLSLLPLMAVPGAVHAINADSAGLFELDLQQLMEITITGATHSDETRETVPSAVTVFDRQQIQRLGVDTLAELANLAPGFQVLRNADSSAYMLSSRGRRLAPSGVEVLLLVDGRRTQDLRLSGISSQLGMPLSNVERVEFIRGPGAALYGTGALMGVINVITRSGASELSVMGGSNQSHRVSLLAAGEGEAVSADFHLDYYGSDGEDFRVPDTFTRAPVDSRDARSVSNAHLKLGWGELNVALRYFEDLNEEFYAQDVVDPGISRNLQRFEEIAFGHSRERERWSTSTQLMLTRTHSEIDARLTPPGVFAAISEPPSAAPLLVNSRFILTNMELENQTVWRLDDDNRLTFGLNYFDHEFSNEDVRTNFLVSGLLTGDLPLPSSPAVDLPTRAYEITSDSFFGVFGQWQCQCRESSQLTLGLRYDRYPDLGQERVSPRLAWVEKLNEVHSLKLLYGEAFRAPNMHELGLTANTFVTGNPDLKPETVATTELIWQGQTRHWFWSLGYFSNSFDNAILQAVAPGNPGTGTRQFVNAEQDDITGFEGEMQWQISAPLYLMASATVITDTDPRTFRDSTELGSLTLNYSVGRWNLNGSLLYRGERGNAGNDEKTREPYWLSHARVQYQLRDTLLLWLNLRNLADDRVYYPATGLGVPGIPSRGRELGLGVTWLF